MNDRSHLSIGEVLNLLQVDFPDVTISKIRFLESQGLLDPERTPSGYRKFYEPDIERLRWILRQQRENFLPLKVIKDRLAEGGVDFAEEMNNGGVAATAPEAPVAPDEAGPPVVPGTAYAAAAATPPTDVEARLPSSAGATTPLPAPAATSAQRASLLQEAPTPRVSAGPSASNSPPTGRALSPPAAAPLFDVGATAVNMTIEELTDATGLTAREVGDLERFGMLNSQAIGATTYYDEDAFLVARLAAGFKTHGVEARHLRMYRVAAEREAGLFEQVIMPTLRKRSPQSRRETNELLNELAALGSGLRTAMLRQLLRDYFDGS